MGKNIGIDLGTTHTVVAHITEQGVPEVLKIQQSSLVPSVICFKDDQMIVGGKIQESDDFPCVSYFKRELGNPHFTFLAYGKEYTPIDLSTFVLRYVVSQAETILEEKITHAVITVPAYFNAIQRNATIQAAEKAGIEVICIINEPTAAAIAYGIDKQQGIALVYDLGGGTFDASIVEINNNSIKVIATHGECKLGGKDFDHRIFAWVSNRILEDYEIVVSDYPELENDILQQCENVKKQLSTEFSAQITVDHQDINDSYEITRDAFEDITRDLIEGTYWIAEEVLQEAKLTWDQVDNVLLVGGATRMPMIAKNIEKVSGKRPISNVNVDEAVALGAALRAYQDTHISPTFILPDVHDVTSHSLGKIAIDADKTKYINTIIISKNSPIPCEKSAPYLFSTHPQEENEIELYMTQGESLNPMQCIILGKYVLREIQHEESGEAIIDISYGYNRNGTVDILAFQRSTQAPLVIVEEAIPEDLSWLERIPRFSNSIFVVIAIDLSSSMSGRPLDEAKRAAQTFAEKIFLHNTHASIAVLGFANQVKLYTNLSQNLAEIHSGINNLQVGLGGGNAAEPFSQSLQILQETPGNKFVVVLTDGVWSYREQAIEKSKICHQQEIDTIAIGFGGADYQFLQAISSCDSNAFYTQLDQLVESFSRIAQVITEKQSTQLQNLS